MKLSKLFARKQAHSVERLDALADKGVRMSGGKEKTSVSASHVGLTASDDSLILVVKVVLAVVLVVVVFSVFEFVRLELSL